MNMASTIGILSNATGEYLRKESVMRTALHDKSRKMMTRSCSWMGVACLLMAASPDQWLTAIWADTFYCAMPLNPQPTGIRPVATFVML